MNRRTGRGDEEGRRERGKGQTVEGGMEGREGRREGGTLSGGREKQVQEGGRWEERRN